MSQNKLVVLKSKLTVYITCYEEAKRTDDLKRMALLHSIISDLQDEIGILDE